MIASFEWTGEALYDVANARLAACCDGRDGAPLAGLDRPGGERPADLGGAARSPHTAALVQVPLSAAGHPLQRARRGRAGVARARLGIRVDVGVVSPRSGSVRSGRRGRVTSRRMVGMNRMLVAENRTPSRGRDHSARRNVSPLPWGLAAALVVLSALTAMAQTPPAAGPAAPGPAAGEPAATAPGTARGPPPSGRAQPAGDGAANAAASQARERDSAGSRHPRAASAPEEVLPAGTLRCDHAGQSQRQQRTQGHAPATARSPAAGASQTRRQDQGPAVRRPRGRIRSRLAKHRQSRFLRGAGLARGGQSGRRGGVADGRRQAGRGAGEIRRGV